MCDGHKCHCSPRTPVRALDSAASVDQFTVNAFFRAKTFNYMTSLYLLASVLASSIGSALLSHHVYILNSLSILCFVLAIAIATFIPPDLGRNTTIEYTSLAEPSSTHMPSSQSGDDDASSDFSIDLSKEAASTDKVNTPYHFGPVPLQTANPPTSRPPSPV